jgi:hypothetical protein
MRPSREAAARCLMMREIYLLKVLLTTVTADSDLGDGATPPSALQRGPFRLGARLLVQT